MTGRQYAQKRGVIHHAEAVRSGEENYGKLK